MTLPVVAIVGRPNVGKSSLFNAISHTRTSIVEQTAGVTRDRVSTICDINDDYFELVDTGGFGIVDRDDLSTHVEQQIRYAVEQADMILFVVDVRDGITPLDRSTAQMLRPYTDRIRLIANKVDNPQLESATAEFVRLGFGFPIATSMTTGLGRTDLNELLSSNLSPMAGQRPVTPTIKISIVGKRNAGKSTFVNALAGEDRVIVSEIPGTTRDSVDVRIEKDGRTLVVIDTAGVRKKRKIADDIEYYASTRATHALQRADVSLLLIDAALPVGQVDKKLADLISSEYKPCIIVVNKWDLAKGLASTEDYGEYLAKVLPELKYAPIAFTTATKGRNIHAVMDLATELQKQSIIRVSTGQLNQAMRESLDVHQPRTKRGRKSPRFYYATQISTKPPTIVVFVNNPDFIGASDQRYLLNRFREQLPYPEIPIRLVFRPRRSQRAV